MKPFYLLLPAVLILAGCASTNTGDPVKDKANRTENTRVRTEIGRGLARFLDQPAPTPTLEQAIFDTNRPTPELIEYRRQTRRQMLEDMQNQP